MGRIDSYRVEHAGTLGGCVVYGSLAAATEAAQRRAQESGRLQLVWDTGAAMYVARIYPAGWR